MAFVVLFHFRLGFDFGYLGVDVFFVISGFVITRLIHGKLLQGTFSFREFYLARFDRLYAPAALMISTSLIAAFFIMGPGAFSTSITTALGALLGFGNVVIQHQTGNYFASQANANLFLHTWSLGVEEQFYLVLPLAVWLAFRLVSKMGKRWITALSGCLSAISLFAYLAKDFFVSSPIWNQVFSFYSPLGRVWEFAAGCLVYFASGHLPRLFARPNALVTWFLMVSLILLQIDIPIFEITGDLRTLITVAMTSLLLMAAVTATYPMAILDFVALRWLGDRSYSIYLWHWPVYVLVGFTFQWPSLWHVSVLEISLTLILAILSYKFVETRRLIWLNRPVLKFRKLTSVALSAAFAAILALVYLPLHHDSADAEQARVSSSQLAYLGCSGEGRFWCLNDEVLHKQRFGPEPIYLVGDSNAEMYFRGLYPAARLLNRDLVSRTRSGCAPVKASFTNQDPGCIEYKNEVASFLKNAPNGLVILALTNYYPNITQSKSSFPREYVQSVESFATYVQSLGDTFAIIKPIPTFSEKNSNFTPDLWPSWVRNRDYRIKVVTDSMSQAFDMAFYIGFASQQVFSAEEQLCPNRNCYLIREGNFIWRDANHITLYGSSLLTKSWVDALLSWH